eukprot:387153-Amphidinium_carterae.1
MSIFELHISFLAWFWSLGGGGGGSNFGPDAMFVNTSSMSISCNNMLKTLGDGNFNQNGCPKKCGEQSMLVPSTNDLKGADSTKPHVMNDSHSFVHGANTRGANQFLVRLSYDRP